MKHTANKFVPLVALLVFWGMAGNVRAAENYASFKQNLSKNYGFDYSLDISYMAQRGAPNGRKTAFQTIVNPSFTWTNFNNEYGSGSLNFSYNVVRYGGISANHLASNIGAVTPINDYTAPSNSFEELYYQYQLGGRWKWLTLGLGQYQIYDFDGNTYLNDQQANFVNYALSQNGTATYALAGVGAFAQAQINKEWSVVIGGIDATNINGISVRVNSLHDKHYATFGSLAYAPTIKGLGSGQYSILVYNQPGVKQQTETTNGWSFSFSQSLNEKWALAGRANGVSGSVSTVKQSWAAGIICNNPFERNALDQFGLAFAYNKISKKAVGIKTYSDSEKVVEAYWALGVSDYMTITPDIQFYIDPALNPKSDYDTVFALRASLFF